MIEKLNYHSWFGYRCLNYKPAHFHATSTPLTVEKQDWVDEKLTGRYSIVMVEEKYGYGHRVLYFEDPQEAILYELTWS